MTAVFHAQLLTELKDSFRKKYMVQHQIWLSGVKYARWNKKKLMVCMYYLLCCKIQHLHDKLAEKRPIMYKLFFIINEKCLLTCRYGESPKEGEKAERSIKTISRRL